MVRLNSCYASVPSKDCLNTNKREQVIVSAVPNTDKKKKNKRRILQAKETNIKQQLYFPSLCILPSDCLIQ